MKNYKFLSKALITIDEARKEFNSDPTFYGALKRLIKHGKIVKLKGGLY